MLRLSEATRLNVEEQLTPESLRALAEGAIDAICVPEYWSPPDPANTLDRIRSACEKSQYTLTDDLQSLGTSIGEYDNDSSLKTQYFAAAKTLSARVRMDFFADAPNPLDKLRATLDEFWPNGCNVARDEPGHMLPAVVRRWVAGGQANPHIDATSIPALSHLGLQRRIGTNIYLSVPPLGAGGNIEFWGRVQNESEYARVKRADYGLERNLLGPPLATVRPEAGMLLMFDASQVHAVTPLESPDRISLACFVGVRREDQPLVVFA